MKDKKGLHFSLHIAFHQFQVCIKYGCARGDGAEVLEVFPMSLIIAAIPTLHIQSKSGEWCFEMSQFEGRDMCFWMRYFHNWETLQIFRCI